MSDTVEFSSHSPRRQSVEALRSLAAASGLPVSHLVELAGAQKLNEIFDPETRMLAYSQGRRIPPVELRTMAKRRDPRVLLAEMEAKRPTRIDGRVALAEMNAKRRRWTS